MQEPQQHEQAAGERAASADFHAARRFRAVSAIERTEQLVRSVNEMNDHVPRP